MSVIRQFNKKPSWVENVCIKYHARKSFLRPESTPNVLPFMHNGATVDCIEWRADGHGVLDGKEVEFCDVRIYMNAPK